MATPPESVMQSHFHTHEYGSCVKEQPPSEWGSIGVYNLPSQRLVGGNSPVSKCRDIAFVILFLGTLVAILAVGAYAIDTGGLHSIFSSPSSSNSSSPIDVSEQHLLIGLSVGFFCFLVTLCVLTIWIIRRWAFGFIIFAVVVTISLFFAFTLWAFYLERWMIGFFLVLLDILLLWSYWICRSFIPFIALVLKIASRSLLLFFGCIILCVFSAIFEGLWLVMIVFFAIASFNNHAITSSSANQSINMSLIGELIFLAFGCFWGLQVIRNVAHVAVSGMNFVVLPFYICILVFYNIVNCFYLACVRIKNKPLGSFATFYFAVNEGNRGAPSFTTLSALRRTVSTSFGSICFGSLFVAIIQFIRFLVNLFLGSTDNSCFKCFLSCCCNCLLSVIETIMSYFNRFAFCYVAIYGTSFLKRFVLCIAEVEK